MTSFYRYFADVNGQTVQFSRVDHRGRKEGSFGWHEATRAWVKIDRAIRYKQFASKHECDARCLNATGRNMSCECACGGKNHGKGGFTVTTIEEAA